MNLAIVHDGLATFGGRGGAEWVLTVLHMRCSRSDFTRFCTMQTACRTIFVKPDIRTSFIQRFPWGNTKRLKNLSAIYADRG